MPAADKKSAPNYYRIRTEERLWQAWGAVKSSGLASTSPRTQSDIKEFDAKARTLIKKIATELRKQTFTFGMAKAVLIPRPAPKGPRPIVMADVRTRVVQRALLDELQQISSFRPTFENPYSFGGVQKRSRAHAIGAALNDIQAGATFFIRSDIKDFFTQIPREKALADIVPHVDVPTAVLLERAMHIELKNAAELGEWRNLFPDEERGVAQGFCLSSLFGNVVLAEFDRQMNEDGRGIRCLRYVDDFLLLGNSERHVMKAFDGALKILAALGLEAYDPRTSSEEKAKRGRTDRSFNFLGCAITRGLVGPSSKATQRLLEKVDERFSVGAQYFESADGKIDRRACLARVLYDVGNIVHGWRKSFDFCEQKFVFHGVDKAIDIRLMDFMKCYWRSYCGADAAKRGAITGIPSLVAPSPTSRTPR